MKEFISHQKARSLVSATGWSMVKLGYLSPTDGWVGPFLGWNGSQYYLTEQS